MLCSFETRENCCRMNIFKKGKKYIVSHLQHVDFKKDNGWLRICTRPELSWSWLSPSQTTCILSLSASFPFPFIGETHTWGIPHQSWLRPSHYNSRIGARDSRGAPTGPCVKSLKPSRLVVTFHNTTACSVHSCLSTTRRAWTHHGPLGVKLATVSPSFSTWGGVCQCL